MKKSLLLSAALLLTGTLTLADPVSDHEIKMGEAHKMMHCDRVPRRAPGMMQPQMIATGDGGVIVLCGMKLYKYDKNLTLKKTVDLPCVKDGGMPEGKDGDGMGRMEDCPFHPSKSDSTAAKPPAKK